VLDPDTQLEASRTRAQHPNRSSNKPSNIVYHIEAMYELPERVE
jgi:hypothetical protein